MDETQRAELRRAVDKFNAEYQAVVKATNNPCYRTPPVVMAAIALAEVADEVLAEASKAWVHRPLRMINEGTTFRKHGDLYSKVKQGDGSWVLTFRTPHGYHELSAYVNRLFEVLA